MKFGEKLEQLLAEKNIKITELSKQTGIPASTLYSAIQRNSEKISLESIRKVCKALDISILVFFEDEPRPRKPRKPRKRRCQKHYVIDGWEIKKMVREAGMRQQDLSEKMGMSRALLNHVLNGRIPCTQKMANRIADALGVPIERFVVDEVKAE